MTALEPGVRPAVAAVDEDQPQVWLNVTTSAAWDRPAVGVVRVERALCGELRRLLGARLRTCVWAHDRFVEWQAEDKDGDQDLAAALDLLLPDLPGTALSRGILRPSLRAYRSSDVEAAGTLRLALPLTRGRRLSPGAGDVVISVGLDWNQQYTTSLHAHAKQHGIRMIVCCYDLIPVLFPQYCNGDVSQQFTEYFLSLTWGSAAVLCISEQTRRDYLALCDRTGGPHRPVTVIPLGDNVPSAEGAVGPQVLDLTASPYILFVSTIERRKNHEVLYRAYHQLSRAGRRRELPKLVFVGMPGWGVDDLLKDIAQDPWTQGLIVQLHHVNDAELHHLYRHALFCVYPSFYEGWGLPVGEALSLGKAVLASSEGSLPEVGGDLVRYVSAWDASDWADEIWRLVSDPAALHALEQRVRARYVPRQWSDTARVVLGVAHSLLAGAPSEWTLDAGYDFHTKVGVRQGPAVRSTGRAGYLVFGPYRAFPPGDYVVEVYADPSPDDAPGMLELDLVASHERERFWEGELQFEPRAARRDVPLARFEVRLERHVADLEFRCRTDARALLSLRRVTLRRQPLATAPPAEAVATPTL